MSTVDAQNGGFYRRRGKRLFDLVVVLLLAVIVLPIIALISVVVYVQMGRPVLFTQRRPGRYGEPFKLLKFRTMLNAVDAEGRPLPDAERMTSLGRVLRATSLDELPELVNVLHGDMSLVGPRPLLMQYLPRYSQEQARRHEVLPGISGWAQVNGRNALSWQQKFEYDVWYVDHLSFILDIKIMLQTISQVLSRSNINQPGAATAEEFTGGKDE